MPGSDMTGWVYRGLTLLIACCPTALALAVPLAFVCGGGRLESEGVHMKGSEAMERTADLRLVVFNKTGTVTTGNLQIKKDLSHAGVLRKELSGTCRSSRAAFAASGCTRNRKCMPGKAAEDRGIRGIPGPRRARSYR